MTQTDPRLIQIDSKPFAITLEPGSSLANKTGSWRDRRPVYGHKLPPCNHACPAGENIQGWLALAQAGKYRAAWDLVARDNPFPATHGRVNSPRFPSLRAITT